MKKQIYAYLHTHWDREWYQNKEDFNLRLLEVFDIVLDELKAKKAPFFYFDGQTSALVDYLKYRPNKKNIISKYIKENKLAIGPYFVSADSYLQSFNAMLKNLDLGISISNKFSANNFIGYMADIFGISKNAFLALQFKNINKAVIWRGINPIDIDNNCNFKYNNIDTTWLVQGYFNDLFHGEVNENSIKNIENCIKKIEKYSSSPLLLPIGGDHLGILKDANEKIKLINSFLKDYEIILSSPFEYFEKSKFKYKTKQIEFLDNKETYILGGVYSARIPQKIKNAKVQNLLFRIVEPLNYYLKENFQQNINDAVLTLLKNHAHDSIYGCSLDEVHRVSNYRFDKCLMEANAILKRIKVNFKRKYNIANKSVDKIGLFNLSSFDNIDEIELSLPYKLKNAQILDKVNAFEEDLLYDIYKIPVTEDIKPIYRQIVQISNNKRFSFSTVDIIKPQKKVKASNNSIENNFIKLYIKNNRVYILDKNNKQEVEMNVIFQKDIGDSYTSAPVGDDIKYSLLKHKINYDKDIQSSISLYYKNIRLNVLLSNNSKFLKFESTINNKNKDCKIQLSFRLKDKIYITEAEDSAGIVKREINPDYNVKNYMPVQDRSELKTNTFPMTGFVRANNLIVLQEGLNEYEVFKNELKICILRSFGTISNPKNPTRKVPAGPNLKTSDSYLLEKYEFQFGIMFGQIIDAFKNLDIFNKNYVAIDGEYSKKNNFTFDKISDNSFIYGMNKDKKIIYNIKDDVVSLI